ncbi:hypothetical protein [Agromyces sp. PvR057]|uniref:hypothetical protein n=1 Tax=Agromyces sp. PvR057 TaxID=3156403 RepID=UPI0033958E90
MELTGDESRAYWSAVAQIIPIIALAIVIETRVLVARWRRKKFRKHRASRWFLAGAYGIVVISLPFAAMTAIINTSVSTTSRWEGFFVLLWVVAGLFLVAYIPAWQLITVALYDLAQSVGDRVPWSKMRRLKRLANEGDLLYAAEIRHARGLRIERLILLADVYMEIVPLEVEADRFGWPYALRRRHQEVHVKLANIWQRENVAKEQLEEWERRMHRNRTTFDTALLEREKSVLRQMNRSIADQLSGIPM